MSVGYRPNRVGLTKRNIKHVRGKSPGGKYLGFCALSARHPKPLKKMTRKAGLPEEWKRRLCPTD
jgi:hypothetical protein